MELAMESTPSYLPPTDADRSLIREYKPGEGFLKFRVAAEKDGKRVVLQKFSSTGDFLLDIISHPQQYYRARSFWGGEQPHVVKWIQEQIQKPEQQKQIQEGLDKIIGDLGRGDQRKEGIEACIEAFNRIPLPTEEKASKKWQEVAVMLLKCVHAAENAVETKSDDGTVLVGEAQLFALIEQMACQNLGSGPNKDILDRLPVENKGDLEVLLSRFSTSRTEHNQDEPVDLTTKSIALLILCQMHRLNTNLQELKSNKEDSKQRQWDAFDIYLKDHFTGFVLPTAT